MKNLSKNILRAAASLGIIFNVSTAQSGCITPPTCEEMGFAMTASDCSGLYTLVCPFDASKFYCTLNKNGANADGTIVISGKTYVVKNGAMGGIKYSSAVSGCTKLGTGFRLPTIDEAAEIVAAKDSLKVSISVSTSTSGSGFIWSSSTCGGNDYLVRYDGTTSCRDEETAANVSVCVKEQ